MLQRILVLLVLGASLSLSAQADNMADATLRLCEKIKSCALAQIAQEDFTPEMRQMMEPMLNGMCVRVQSQVTDVPTGHPLYGPALACMQSMDSMTCESLRDGQTIKTPECEAYEKEAQKYESNL